MRVICCQPEESTCELATKAGECSEGTKTHSLLGFQFVAIAGPLRQSRTIGDSHIFAVKELVAVLRLD